MLSALIRFFLENKFVTAVAFFAVLGWGVMTAPFDWSGLDLPRDPVPVDAIPDIGENQQIVFSPWAGRSPSDVEDQLTYPLTTALLGIPGVRTIRSHSFFGFSSIYIVFREDVEFYWSRSRILEKLSSLPPGTLPPGVRPVLGPDATALGQVFWYTLEGRDPEGAPAGGWNLEELRSIQDWYVRYALASVEGVSEVASVGGYVREYQVDVDPEALRAYGVTLPEVFDAVRKTNRDVGARNLEINRVEYVIRARGLIESIEDIENTVIKRNGDTPVLIRHVANVGMGPAGRRGALDKEGAEAVGGVVVVRYGTNPLAVIRRVKEKIREIAPGLPSKTLEDGTVSRVRVVPFYDRTGLIHETLGTLESALTEEILITVIVIVLMVGHLRSSLLISGLLPASVLLCFVFMKVYGIDANIVALSGIAIAIGTIVDMGIVLCENILNHLEKRPDGEKTVDTVFRASVEVGGAVLTAVATTVVGFIPVFAMTGAEGKLFRPLAFTKTFALIASILFTLTVLPALAHALFPLRVSSRRARFGLGAALLFVGGVLLFRSPVLALPVVLFSLVTFFRAWISYRGMRALHAAWNTALALGMALLLARHWVPLGPERGWGNFAFVFVLVWGTIAILRRFMKGYPRALEWCLEHKALFLSLPALLVFLGTLIWLGVPAVFSFMPSFVKESAAWERFERAFPGLGKEFMPPLDEGSFLWMPTTMPHASIGEALDVLQKQDRAIRAIPEIENVVGKIGRVDSPLDPAPLSMIETLITYKSEYRTGPGGRRLRFRYDEEAKRFERDEDGELIPDPGGRVFRQWRPEIDAPDDIWNAIRDAARIPGTTSAPRLQPIAARIVMLQSGMRAPMGVKVFGPDLETIERVALEIEKMLKEVPSVNPDTVLADRVIGKPFFEISIDREAIARYGLSIDAVSRVIEVAVGGKTVTLTVEGRERYPVRVRYQRELRDRFDTLEKILVPAPGGLQVPLDQLASFDYVPGPQVIKSEDTFPVAYVVFDKRRGYSEVGVVEACRARLEKALRKGEWTLPGGVSYRFAGSYENQVRSEKKLKVVLPLALLLIFLILYLQFRSAWVTVLVFSGVFVAWAGGFILIRLYGTGWFMNFSFAGIDFRELFQIHTMNLSVAVWVGFLALFGIATDNGVILATYLNQTFRKNRPRNVKEIRAAVVEASRRRIRPCLMTTATTLLALVPILTSTGRGSDVMVPMAIPSFGGMCVVIVSVFFVPVVYGAVHETRLRFRGASKDPGRG